MISMIRLFLGEAKNTVDVEVIYLVSGHTYMPCDSVHSAIEGAVKNVTVWAPSQWTTFILGARKDESSSPYQVLPLKTEDVLDFKTFGEKDLSGFPVQQIRTIRLTVEGRQTAMVRTSLKGEEEEITIERPRRRSGRPLRLTPAKAYDTKQNISMAKFGDLMKLVDSGVVPIVFADELRQFRPGNVPDTIDETDEEEELGE